MFDERLLRPFVGSSRLARRRVIAILRAHRDRQFEHLGLRAPFGALRPKPQ